MFKGATYGLSFKPLDGQKVVIYGNIDVYEVGGSYQLYVKKMEQAGLGELYEKFEQLKKKLSSEGLFLESHKKRLPYLPNRVGVVTSPTGAVIQDIINVSSRRFKSPNILLYPAQVQGEKMAESVIEGIEYFNKNELVDVIIVARGGGSFEDLFGFNDEKLAHAIYDSKIPVVSAVGHETDYTICDFVADMRAPTPSAAAELVYPSQIEITQKIDSYVMRAKNAIKSVYQYKKQYLEMLKADKLSKTVMNLINKNRITLSVFEKDIITKVKQKFVMAQNRFKNDIALLDSFSPLKTLGRGYTVAQNEQGRTIKCTEDVTIGSNFKTLVIDGNIISTVVKVNKER